MAEYWVSEKELGELKPLLPAALAHIGITDDGTVSAVAVNCLQRHLDGESIHKAMVPLLDAGVEKFLVLLRDTISAVKKKKSDTGEPKRLRDPELPPLIDAEHKDKRSRTEKDSRDSRHRDERDSHRDRERSDRDRKDKERSSRHDRDDRDNHRDRDRERERERDREKDRRRERDRGGDDRKRRRDDDDKKKNDADVKREGDAPQAEAPAPALAAAEGGEVKADGGPAAKPLDLKTRLAAALAKAKKAKEDGGSASAPHAAANRNPDPNSTNAVERLAAMQQRVAAQLRRVKGVELPSMPHILRVDDQGREVDSDGRVLLPSKKAVAATTLINKKRERERVMKLMAPPASITDPRKNPFFDPRLPGGEQRKIKMKKAFVFKEAGSYVKAAQKARAEAAKEQQVKDAQVEGENIADDATATASVAGTKVARPKEAIPAIEWWDVPVLREESTPSQTKVAIPGDIGARSYDAFIAEERITHYVEHPIAIEPIHELPPPPPRPLMMTKEERKKFRKKNRMEMQKEKRERQLLGLEAPPEPKVKISNLYRVLGTQAVADPSALEKMVREQMAARLQAHEQRNQERKLTPEEKSEKKKKRMQEDTSKQVCACLFKVKRLVTLARAKFKVDINAQQLFLTGCVITCGDTTLILAEGGPKGLKKYKTLLGRRVDWNEEPGTEKEKSEDGKPKEPDAAAIAAAAAASAAAAKDPNKCELVWEGTLGRTTFRNFRFEAFENDVAARKFLQDRGVGHLWDLGKAHVVGESPAILLD